MGRGTTRGLQPESRATLQAFAESTFMWQFGKLLESWNRLDDHGHDLVSSLLQDDCASRPSADQALQHAFIGSVE